MKSRSGLAAGCDAGRRYFLMAPALLPAVSRAQAPRVVRFVRPDFRVPLDRWYPFALLRAALDASGERFLIETRESLTQARATRELQHEQGVIDVYAMAPTPERERRLQLLPMPLYRGLFGWRLLLARPDTAAQLQGLKDLAALRRLLLLQGEDWPDTGILRANGLRVLAGSTQLHRLHAMLVEGRADLFPRALNEAWREADAEPAQSPRFVVLPGLALRYRSDLFFFTRRDDQRLTPALQRGLTQLQRSGQFDALLRDFHGEAIARSALGSRQLIELRNPLLPPGLRAQPAALWTLPAAA